MKVFISRHWLIASTMRRLYALIMQPWSVILMREMRSRRRFIARDAQRRQATSLRMRRIEPT